MSNHDASHDSGHHIVPVSTYFLVFFALIVLTVITVYAAFFDFGALNIVVALGVATVKASLVVFFFMHIKYGPKLNALVLFSAIFMLVTLLAFLMSDYATRPYISPNELQPNSAPQDSSPTMLYKKAETGSAH